jgi:hypothetical protein
VRRLRLTREFLEVIVCLVRRLETLVCHERLAEINHVRLAVVSYEDVVLVQITVDNTLFVHI